MESDRKFRVAYPKRLLDLVLVGACLVILSPVLLLIILVIVLDSPGPVFFVSKRMGCGCQVFDFYKFRTMCQNAEQMRDHLKGVNHYQVAAGSIAFPELPFFFKVPGDPRVTRVGKILRKISLDELPQLLNVLKGDMSLVGNRPLPLDEAATLLNDTHKERFLAPAGITGLWQTAENKDRMTVNERVSLDIQYAREHSLRLDWQILLKTLPAMLQKE